MSRRAKREYLKEIQKRYQNANKQEKKQLLDEAEEITGYNRKYMIRFFSGYFKHQSKPQKRGPKVIYNQAFVNTLETVWNLCNRPCSELLKAMIPNWLPFIPSISEKTKRLLCKVSPATIDRKLFKVRAKYEPKGIATTRSGGFLRENVPIKLSSWDEKIPGHFEVDTVAHCGESTAGDYVNTLDAVDLATGWTELRAVWSKTEQRIKKAVENIETNLPFPILGWDVDNGGEILNKLMYKYFVERKNPVQFTRCRPYRKNDQAHVEQKNWSRVRQLIGYLRFDKPELAELLDDIYKDWGLLTNYFMPSFKLTEKYRIGESGRVKRKYGDIVTPYQRLIESSVIPIAEKIKLKAIYNSINPVKLKAQIDTKVTNILRISRLP